MVWKKYARNAVRIVEDINIIFHDLYKNMEAGSKAINNGCHFILSLEIENDEGITVTIKNLNDNTTLQRKMGNLKDLPALIKAVNALKTSSHVASKAVTLNVIENSIDIGRGCQCAIANDLYDLVKEMEKALEDIEERLHILRQISDRF